MPDRWLVLTVRAPSDEQLEALAEGLVALGGNAVHEEGDRLTTWLAPPPDPDAFLRAASRRLRSVNGLEPELTWGWQPDQDWSRSWREGLSPRRVGRRLVVAQPWNVPVDAPLPGDGSAGAAGDAWLAAGSVVLVIDPGTAFGTGEHATTRGALRLMESVLEGGERVLDVGTGSGILALAAAGLGAREVLAAESDPESIGNARENLDRSPLGERVELVNAEVDAHYLSRRRGAGFDLIMANVLSGVLIPLLPAFRDALTPGGAVVLGGILEEEAARVLEGATEAGLTLAAEDREEGWWTGLLQGPA